MSDTKNELETLLEKAATEPAHRPAFFSALLEATVWVPGRAADGEQIVEDSALDLQHWEKDDGTSVIPFFTSLEALQQVYAITLTPAVQALRFSITFRTRRAGDLAVWRTEAGYALDLPAWAMDPATNYDTYFVPQGIGADLIATIEGFSREDVDAYAARSQERAAAAWSGGYFAKSVVPVKDQNGLVVLDHDEHMRPGTTVESLGKLKPAFADLGAMGGFDDVALQKYHYVEKINHVHTGGNSSGIVDGAALLLVGNERVGQEMGLTPRARIVSTAVIGSEPTIMLTGPAPSCRKALDRVGMKASDIDLVEINEAFAAVALKLMRDMGWSEEQTNVNGGAIAMGHPLGATGAMILGTLVDELERRDLERGIATLCIGGGMGVATIVERV